MKTYIAIDLKSFYASVECVYRGLDPLDTNLVVADSSRTEKTICLAVSPSLKSIGLPGRARLFEAIQKVNEYNTLRQKNIRHNFYGKSFSFSELEQNKNLALDFIIATPRMAEYMRYSGMVYKIYLKYIAPEDIHVYSIDEVFMDVTNYLNSYKMSADALAYKIIKDILKETGITATAGIGTNMYLAKVAMDIKAKHIIADKDGVRIAFLNEDLYKKELWSHTPITDFWRVGKGYAKKLNEMGLFTMGDVARCSLGKKNDYYNEELLYKAFGINAELLIDHAWGYEPCTIKDIKAYVPQNTCIGQGQVLHCGYNYEATKIVIKEMADSLCLDLVEKKLTTSQIVLTLGYDIENIKEHNYDGEIVKDRYGRDIPKHSHGTINLPNQTSSSIIIIDAISKLYDNIVNKSLTIKRINISINKLVEESNVETINKGYEQLDLFNESTNNTNTKLINKEKNVQKTIIELKSKFGKNAVIKGIDLDESATAIDRNKQIGGHKA